MFSLNSAVVISLFLCYEYGAASERQLKPYYNPWCDPEKACNSSAKLMYVQSTGDGSILHHLWDFTYKPTFISVLTPAFSNISINWEALLQPNRSSCSINFTKPIIYLFGVTFNKLYEYNDDADSGKLPIGNHDLVATDTNQLKWKTAGFVTNRIENSILFTMQSAGCKNCSYHVAGGVKLKVSTYGHKGHANLFPSLAHTENSTQIDITLENINTSFKKSRFAFELVTFSSDSSDSFLVHSSKQSMDDEHTPGVFMIDALTISHVDNKTALGKRGGYLQWKPVAYTAVLRDMSNSTQVLSYGVQNVTDDSAFLRDTIASALCGFVDSPDLNRMVKAENISVGFTEDGFYRKTNFSSWTFVMGIGELPQDSYSMFVTLTLCIGLGVPIILMIGSAIYIVRNRLYGNH